MRARVGFTFACISAFTIAICAGSLLEGQTAAPQNTGVSTQDSTNDLSVAVGKSVLVDCAHPIKRVAIGLGDLAEASAVTPTEILLNGKAAGETSLIIWEVGGERQFFNVSVRGSSPISTDRLDILRRELRTELPGQTLKVSSDGANVYLRGTVKDLSASDRAVQIASTAGKVVNLLYVAVPPSDPQILLKVRFASVDRSLEKQLGINFFSTGFGNVVGAANTGQYSPPGLTLPTGSGTSSTASISNQLNLFAFLPGLNLGATLESLENKGIVQVLAEPNVMAINGKQASFLAGGEYPYPVVQGTSAGGAGAVTIEFKEFGVRLNFVPTVTPRGSIRLQVAPEVSSLDFTNAIQISGFDVPAIDTRKMKTEVELSDGQSFAISGLLDNRDTEAYSKIPFLGDIPILGKLFQSMQKTRTNTELIVIVTPEIVSPIQAGAPLPELHYPTKFLPPNSSIPMNTPDAKTAANTMAPAPPSMPVERLIESMKPETPLVVDSGTVTFGGATAGAAGSATSNSPAPVTTAPQ
ncbi:type II and III secretion system protein family protein [Acidicapsa acidisoli]|uniref:type II and III secretion system protein family protein n=1 Tax=Acidicapsa acidisoli TaxID=1615681 RepID=UPI0021DFFEDA|nr:type II and III secretion system protein family protein [Acidicapsa acidisoli]